YRTAEGRPLQVVSHAVASGAHGKGRRKQVHHRFTLEPCKFPGRDNTYGVAVRRQEMPAGDGPSWVTDCPALQVATPCGCGCRIVSGSMQQVARPQRPTFITTECCGDISAPAAQHFGNVPSTSNGEVGPAAASVGGEANLGAGWHIHRSV